MICASCSTTSARSASRALAGVVRRGLDCGALDDAEVAAATGLDRVTPDGLAASAGAEPPDTA